MSKITKININLPMHSEVYEVDTPLEIYNNDFSKQIVTRIAEASIEKDNSFTHIIQVFVGDNVTIAKEFINTPMSITYGDDS